MGFWAGIKHWIDNFELKPPFFQRDLHPFEPNPNPTPPEPDGGGGGGVTPDFDLGEMAQNFLDGMLSGDIMSWAVVLGVALFILWVRN